MDWSETLAWWPYRPLLRSTSQLPFGQPTEEFVARSDKGGRKADPRTDVVSLLLLYERPGTSIVKQDSYELLKAGGMLLRVSTYGALNETFRPTPSEDTKTVVVRGHAAFMDTYLAADGTNVDFRMIWWEAIQPDATRLLWLAGSNPLVYTDDEAIAWVNALTEQG